MNYFLPVTICLWISAVFFPAYASAADSAKGLGLTCQVEQLVNKKKLQFSVVLDEKNRLATINETVFKNSEFNTYSIKGKVTEPHYAVAGVNRVIQFTLDRLTGEIFFGSLVSTESGGPYTEEQKEQLGLYAADPVFIGTCKPARPLF